MHKTVNSLIEQLKSDGVKERQAAISSLRNALARDAVVAGLDTTPKRLGWLALFQALFTAVLNEKSLATHGSKSAPAATKRVADIAAAVRWLTQRSVHQLTHKNVIRALLNHLVQTSVHQGTLYLPVALDYAKAIRCVLDYPPHLEHIDDEMWVKLTEMSLNVVLGDSLRKRLDQGDVGDEVADGEAEEGSDSGFEGEGSDADLPSTSSPNKRRRREGSGTPGPSALRGPPRTQHRSVTVEQIEFTSLLSHLLTFPSAPLLSNEYPNLGSAILNRLLRFLCMYPSDTSLHPDYVIVLSSTLSHLALNKRDSVTQFAQKSWDALLGLWGTKSRPMKENLIAVLRTLFPFYTSHDPRSGPSLEFSYAKGVSHLWYLLDGEAESRWGVDGLSLDSLRLSLAVSKSDSHQHGPGAFEARTFRYGWDFDASQALSWAILELQADCAEKLHALSESLHSRPPDLSRREGKRAKLDSPIVSLLHSIQSKSSSRVRSYHLQVLLFFIDRHWVALHEDLRQNILSNLLQFISGDDAVTQSWVFLCLAAIAENQVSLKGGPASSLDTSQTWDPIWTHAIRRADVPIVCRSACHLAYILLLHAKQLLTSQRILPEIEAFANDMGVQGPPYPYDAVCAFVALCLQVANQDMRLHRMRMEDKVLSWLADSYSLDALRGLEGGAPGGRLKISRPLVSDIVLVLAVACGFSKRTQLLCRMLLPECTIVSTVKEERRSEIIRNFSLHAQLPPFKTPSSSLQSQSSVKPVLTAPSRTGDLAPPSPRERKASSILLKILESIDTSVDGDNALSAGRARSAVDFAVMGISFEGLLSLNGTQSNRRVLHAAYKTLAFVAQSFTSKKWTLEEKASVLLGFDSLVRLDECDDDIPPWIGLLGPSIGSGIRRATLQRLTDVDVETKNLDLPTLRELQRVIWQTPEAPEFLSRVIAAMKTTLRVVLAKATGHSRIHDVMEADDQDDFGSVNVHSSAGTVEASRHANGQSTAQVILDVCMSSLTVGPILQSSGEEPTRDRELTDIILNCDGDEFLLACGPYLANIRRRALHINLTSLDNLLIKVASLSPQYLYQLNDELKLTVVRLLDSTMHLWIQPDVVSSETVDKVRHLFVWLLKLVRITDEDGNRTKTKVHSWRVRDSIVAFLARYMTSDPFEQVWVTKRRSDDRDDDDDDDDVDPTNLPSRVLPSISQDDDIRVRFRAANANAILFTLSRFDDDDPMTFYRKLHKKLPIDLANYEHVLTRLITLGSIMVVSSAVRRGTLWHLMETSHGSGLYNLHIKAVFQGASDRLGLGSASELFELYVPQIAFSVFSSRMNFLSFPPEVLGFEDRKACAEAAFRAFAPVLILAGGSTDQEAVTLGRRWFGHHCQAIQLPVFEGYRRYFADIVGFESVLKIGQTVYESPELATSLSEQALTAMDESWITGANQNQMSAGDQMVYDIDSIIVVVLRFLQNESCEEISQELSKQSSREAQVFRALTIYRDPGEMKAREPNRPSFNAASVLATLKWLEDRVPAAVSVSTTYHITQQLLADIQNLPLVHEQLRYMSALCLWMSRHFRHFRNPALLYALNHGMVTLLEQTDLALAAQSVLDWSFRLYAKTTERDPRLADLLIRLICVAHDHVNSKSSAIAKLGANLLPWIESQVLQLARFPSTRHQVLKAIPAWPREPSPELLSICKDTSAQSLASILSDPHNTSNKFTIVRRLRELSLTDGYSTEQFSRINFWRLKDCIPSSNRLQATDINAFASLLLSHRGQIHSFGLNPLSAQATKDQQISAPRAKSNQQTGEDPSIVEKRPILDLLFPMLNSDVPSKVQMAYRVLRTIAAATDLSQSDSWTTEHSSELGYFRDRPRQLVNRSPAQLDTLVSTDAFVDMAENFKNWITTFSTLLCDVLIQRSIFYAQLPAILQLDSELAQQVAPILVHTLLSASMKSVSTSGTPRDILSQYFSRILKSPSPDVSSRRAIVNIVLHLRHSQPPDSKDETAYDKWLDIDFLLLSKSAIISGAYTTALLFHELAMEYSTPGGNSPSSADTENILFEIYSRIEEPDSFYGIKTEDLRHFLLKRFHHERQWEKAFKFHGAALETHSQDTAETEGVLHSLHSFGFDTLALSVQQNVTGAGNMGAAASDMVYHLGWRTGTWDLPDQVSNSGSGATLYNALRAVSRERDPRTVDAIVGQALFDEMERLRALGDEDLVGIREVTQSILCLSQIDLCKDDLQKCLQNGMLDSNLWSKFSDIDGDFDFSVLETIMATRISLLRSAREKEQRQQIGTRVTPFISSLMDIEKLCLTRVSEASRKSNNLQIALNSIVRAQKLESSPSAPVAQEFANVLWDQKEHKVAVQFLKGLISRHFPELKSGPAQDLTERALLLSRLGSWTSEACLEKPTNIWSHYFSPAASLLTELAASANRPTASVATVYHQCAVFADRQYHAILKSPDAIKWKLYAERKEKEIQQRKEQIMRTHSGSTAFRELTLEQNKAEKLLREDTQLYRKHNESLNSFLQQAVDMYSRCLQASDDFDNDGHIRLVSLWFANFNDSDLQDGIGPSLDRIPSRKFVFLAHQLTARLAKPSNDPITGSQEALQSLVLRMCRDHPFHSLYQVYCLQPSTGNPGGSRRSSVRHDPSLAQGERAAAAADIFDRLRGDSSSKQRVLDVGRVCDAYLQWAKRSIKNLLNKERSAVKIPEDMLILKLRNVRVPVLTANTPVDPTLQYENCAWIQCYESTFTTAGGINVPKICHCRGSDGVQYKQLFKGEGNDDLRQDAVMEQVFELVNVVLHRDRETRRRNLSVRGYKVIPLAPQAGVLEFVGNTIPINSWISAAHPRYHKEDIPWREFNAQMARVRDQNRTSPSLNDKLTTQFLSLRARFRPVMRHFFAERQKTPMSWFAMRLNYTRSVATTSIVGHILGLGDRHTSNILLDSGTGEVVHIDLGIAFEQGKLLPVPECVPFRMTADMVDGMGTAGTQGVFARCAEETLRVLRGGSEVVLTVLEVFKYDPLHSWTASEFKIKRAQGSSTAHAPTPGAPALDMSSGTADEEADRALTTVARKLDRALSAEYTVNELIAEATDPANLARMYIGWGQYW